MRPAANGREVPLGGRAGSRVPSGCPQTGGTPAAGRSGSPPGGVPAPRVARHEARPQDDRRRHGPARPDREHRQCPRIAASRGVARVVVQCREGCARCVVDPQRLADAPGARSARCGRPRPRAGAPGARPSTPARSRGPCRACRRHRWPSRRRRPRNRPRLGRHRFRQAKSPPPPHAVEAEAGGGIAGRPHRAVPRVTRPTSAGKPIAAPRPSGTATAQDALRQRAARCTPEACRERRTSHCQRHGARVGPRGLSPGSAAR